ncbi:amidase domain-containing protein [Dermabacteraceae bacterium P13264]
MEQKISRRGLLAATTSLGMLAVSQPEAYSAPIPETITQGDRDKAENLRLLLETTDRHLVSDRNEFHTSRVLRSNMDTFESARNLDLSNAAAKSLNSAFNWEKETATSFQELGKPDVLESRISTGELTSLTVWGRKFLVVPTLVERRLDEDQVWVESSPFILEVDHNDKTKALWRPGSSGESPFDMPPIPSLKHKLTSDILTLGLDPKLAEAPYMQERMLKQERDGGNPASLYMERAVTGLGMKGRMKASNYALQYYFMCNPKYRIIEGNDCTNFASQAMFAGGWKKISGLYNRSTSIWDYSEKSHKWTWTWVNVRDFRTFAIKQKRSKAARYATDLWHGNIVQVKTPRGGWSHTAIVTGKSGKQPLLTYHSNSVKNSPFPRFRAKYKAVEKQKGFQWHFHLT